MSRRRFKRKRIGFISKAVLGMNMLVMLALLASYLAPHINPQSFWPIAFFGIAYLPLVIINGFFIIYWLVRKPMYALLSLVVFFIGWGAFRKHIGFSAPVPAEATHTRDSTSLRVMSYNAHTFRHFEENAFNPGIKDAVLQLIDSIAPDVICFQEYYSRKKGEHNVTATMSDELGYKHMYFIAADQNDHEAIGLAIFSRFPIRESGHLSEQQYGVNGIIYVDIERPSGLIRVYNVHLRSFGFQQEDYEFVKAPSQELEKDMSATRRIGSRLKQAFTLRSLQAEAVRKHTSSLVKPHLIMGDFNDTPLSYTVNQVAKNMQNAFREKGRGWGETYNGDFPNFQIDYILASKDFSIARYQIVKKKLSDHYPIWADLYLD